MKEKLRVITTDGNSFDIDPGGGSDHGTQARRLGNEGAMVPLGDGIWAFIPAHQIARVELVRTEDA